MRPLFTLAILFTLTITCSLGQKKYGAGYYVTTAGDTVRGEIEYLYNYNQGFKFRSSPEEESKKFGVEDATTFVLRGGNTYQRLDFGLGDLSAEPVFAQRIIDGTIDLYSYQGRLFVDGGGANKFRMAKPKAKTTEETKKYYQQNVGYFNILFEDCPAVRSDAATVAISSKRLTDLIIRYHQCRQIPFTQLPASVRESILGWRSEWPHPRSRIVSSTIQTCPFWVAPRFKVPLAHLRLRCS